MPSNSKNSPKIPIVKASTSKKTVFTKIKTSVRNTTMDSNKPPRFNSKVKEAILSIKPVKEWKLYESANTYSIDNHRAIGKVFSYYYNNPESEFNVTYLGGHTEIIKGKHISAEALESERFAFSTNYYVNARIYYDTISTTYENGSAYIYARVSVKNDTSYSIAAQLQRTTAYVRDNMMVTSKIFVDDGVSARDMKNLNNELGFWINDVYFPHIEYFKEKDQNLILIVDKVDRLSRNVAKGIEFIRKIISTGGEVHFVSDNIVCTKDNWLSNTKFKVIEYLNKAEQESDTISERVRKSYEYRRNHKDDDITTSSTSTTTDEDEDECEYEDEDEDEDIEMSESDKSYESSTNDNVSTTDEDETSSQSTDSSSRSDPFASLVSALNDAVRNLGHIRKYYKKK